MITKKIVYEDDKYKIKDTVNMESLIPALEAFTDFMSIIELILREYENYKVNGLENINIEIFYDESFKNIKFNLNFRYFQVRLIKYKEGQRSVNLWQQDKPKKIILDRDYTIYYKDGKLEGKFIKQFTKSLNNYFSIEYQDGMYRDYVNLIRMYHE